MFGDKFITPNPCKKLESNIGPIIEYPGIEKNFPKWKPVIEIKKIKNKSSKYEKYKISDVSFVMFLANKWVRIETIVTTIIILVVFNKVTILSFPPVSDTRRTISFNPPGIDPIKEVFLS